VPQGLEDELDRADWQSSSASAQTAVPVKAERPPALPPPPPAAAALPPPPPNASAAKSEAAGGRVAGSRGSYIGGGPVTVSSSTKDRKRARVEDSNVAGIRGVISASVVGPAHAAVAVGNGVGKPPLGLDKRKRKDSGLDEPMYRRAEAAVMDDLWCGLSLGCLGC